MLTISFKAYSFINVMKNKSKVLKMNQAELTEAYESVMREKQTCDRKFQQAHVQNGQFERTTILRDTDIRYSFTTELQEA